MPSKDHLLVMSYTRRIPWITKIRLKWASDWSCSKKCDEVWDSRLLSVLHKKHTQNRLGVSGKGREQGWQTNDHVTIAWLYIPMNYSKVQLISTLLPVFEVKDKKNLKRQRRQICIKQANNSIPRGNAVNTKIHIQFGWMIFFNLKDFLHHPENFWGNDMITAAKIAVIRKNILRECWQQLLTMFTSKFVDGYFLVQFYKSL